MILDDIFSGIALDKHPELAEPIGCFLNLARQGNPVYAHVMRYQHDVDPRAPEAGMSPAEWYVLMNYIAFRALPTIKEISAFNTLLVLRGLLGDARTVGSNLADEMGRAPEGKAKEIKNHVDLMFQSFQSLAHVCLSDDMRMSDWLYKCMNLVLRARRDLDEGGFGYQTKDIQTLSDMYDHENDTASRLPFSRTNWIEYAAQKLDQYLPKNPDMYARHVDTLISGEHAVPKTFNHAAGAVRLAVREWQSNHNDGVVGTWGAAVDPMRGWFPDQKSFDKMRHWVTVHMGKPGTKVTGVEDRHMREAITMTQFPIRKLMSLSNGTGPELVARMLRQEGDLVQTRSFLAGAFASALQNARERDTRRLPPQPCSKSWIGRFLGGVGQTDESLSLAA
jgi:hypothetical protein